MIIRARIFNSSLEVPLGVVLGGTVTGLRVEDVVSGGEVSVVSSVVGVIGSEEEGISGSFFISSKELLTHASLQ